MTAEVVTRALDVRYGEDLALSGVEVEIAAGSTMAVIGPNGSGKSTLLKVMAGIQSPSSGSIQVQEAKPALVLQSTDVDRSVPISARTTIAMARYPTLGLLRRFTGRDRAAVDRAMQRLDIADLADRQLHELSGGQRQRVLVAQGLAQESSLLLLDEPVNGLDLVSRSVILDVMDEERAVGRTVVMSTHNLDEARRCDQVLLLATRAIAVGTPEEVLIEEHLRAAFGGRFIRVGDELVLDDPHHAH